METLNNLFWGIVFISFLETIIKTIFLLLLSFLIIWLIQLITVKLVKRHKVKREELLKITFLTSLVAYFLFFSIYLGLLIRHNGLHTFQWAEPGFYLGIIPVIVTFLAVSSIFIFATVRFNKPLKRN